MTILTPACGKPATIRIEVYSPAGGSLYGSLDASVYACDQHEADAVAAIWTASLTAYRVYMAPDASLPCGRVYAYPTGGLGGGAR